MIKVLYSTLKGRDTKIFITLDQTELNNIVVDGEENELNNYEIKQHLRKIINESEIEYRIDPFIKHLEETGNHLDLEDEKE